MVHLGSPEPFSPVGIILVKCDMHILAIRIFPSLEVF